MVRRRSTWFQDPITNLAGHHHSSTSASRQHRLTSPLVCQEESASRRHDSNEFSRATCRTVRPRRPCHGHQPKLTSHHIPRVSRCHVVLSPDSLDGVLKKDNDIVALPVHGLADRTYDFPGIREEEGTMKTMNTPPRGKWNPRASLDPSWQKSPKARRAEPLP
jgi:hypothetical protein